MDISYLTDVWAHDVRPPDDEPRKYNATLEFSLPVIDLHLTGTVTWNEVQSQYVFHFQSYRTQEASRYRVKFGFLLLKPEDYLKVREVLRGWFGLFVTTGIYDETDPPQLPDPHDFYVQPQVSSYH